MDILLNFVPQQETIERRASFNFPMNFNGELKNAYETQSGDYIIAEFEGTQTDVKTKTVTSGIVPIIQKRGVWAGLFIDHKIEAPCFVAGLKIMTDKSKVKFAAAD